MINPRLNSLVFLEAKSTVLGCVEGKATANHPVWGGGGSPILRPYGWFLLLGILIVVVNILDVHDHPC